MAPAAVTVGDYIIASGGGAFTPAQVVDLACIAHGYALAITGRPLFRDVIKAGRRGPVVQALHDAVRGFGEAPVPRLCSCGTPVTDPGLGARMEELGSMLGEPARAITDAVLKIYGPFAAFQLSRVTGAEGSPWAARGRGRADIPDGAIKKYYEDEIRMINQNTRRQGRG